MLFLIRLTRNSNESRHSILDNIHSDWVSVAEIVVTSLAQLIGRQARRGTRLSRIPADQEVETLVRETRSIEHGQSVCKILFG